MSDKYGTVVDNSEEAMIEGMQKIISDDKRMLAIRRNLEHFQYGDGDVLGAISSVLG